MSALLDDDPFTAAYRAEVAREARAFSGPEVLTLREALDRSAAILAVLNTKGMPFDHRQGVERARQALMTARPLLFQRATTGTPPGGPTNTGRP